MDVRVNIAAEHLFRPEIFFLGRTEGSGVLRPLFGGATRHCSITTSGERRAAYGALSLEETFAFTDGEVDIWRWVISASGDGKYIASEQSAGSGIAGHHAGNDYVINFHRPLGVGKGPLSPGYRTRFTLLAPDLALKQVRVSVLGAPVATFTGVHRRLAA